MLRVPRALAGLTFAAALLSLGSGCARSIGDGCTVNVECSPLGDRFCDTAQPGGYCTVEGCDYNTCPDGAACIRFFSLLRNGPTCQPGCTPGSAGCCSPGQLCLQDQGGVAYCANERTEHRWCMHPCGSDSDCREGYVCNQAGLCGSAVVPYLDASGKQITQDTGYCAVAPAAATNVCGRR